MEPRLDRRAVLTGTAALTAATSSAASASASTLPEPGLSFAFQLDVALGPVQEVGMVDGLRRRIVPIVGGTVAGPRLKGVILPGGADWQGVRPSDGLTRVSARYWMRADDGQTISVENNGVRRAPPEVMQRLMAGETVSPQLYYFRATPSFEVGAGPHQWLNESVFVCVGARFPDKAVIRVYAVT